MFDLFQSFANKFFRSKCCVFCYEQMEHDVNHSLMINTVHVALIVFTLMYRKETPWMGLNKLDKQTYTKQMNILWSGL